MSFGPCPNGRSRNAAVRGSIEATTPEEVAMRSQYVVVIDDIDNIGPVEDAIVQLAVQ